MSSSAERGSRPPTTASRPRRCSTQQVGRPSRPRSWKRSGSARARRPGGRRSTIACCPPRPGYRARGQLHEGLLSGPGADRAAALPRPREPGAAGARARRSSRSPRRSCLRGQERRPDHERRARRGGALALAYVRREVPEDAELRRRPVDGDAATLIRSRAPVAQGIERCPAEAEVASSNLARAHRGPWPGGSRRAEPGSAALARLSARGSPGLC